MKSQEIFYPESKFGGFTDIDGTVVFYSRVNALLTPDSVVLDVGCGRGSFSEEQVPIRRDLRIFKGKAARVIGIDVDPAARQNPYLDEFHLLQSDDWPVPDDSVDLIICSNVIEHMAHPDRFFAEAKRVLRDQGVICIRTPNQRSYVSLMARLIPNRYHAKVASKVQDGRKEEDVFPTLYRCNTVGKLRRHLRDAGFDCVVYGYEAEPSYLSFSKIAYFFGVLHQRFAPSFIKPAIFAFGRLRKNG